MEKKSRTELLRLIEALIESEASEQDVARLESLVLQSAEARRIYIQAMQIHGQLYWDAAGAGSMEMPVATAKSRRQSTTMATAMTRWQAVSIHWKSMVTILLLVGVSSFWLGRSITSTPQKIVTLSQVADGDKAVGSDGATGENGIVSRSASERTIRGVKQVKFPQLSVPKILLPSTALDEFSEESVANHGGVHSVDRPLESARDWTIEIANIPATDGEMVDLINELLRDFYEEEQVTPVAKSQDEEWVRRVYLDLVGRIPTSLEATTFINDPSADKRAALLDSLLNSRGFARYQATNWTNLLIGRSRQDFVRRDLLQDWLARQFRENRPWRETVGELIAAVGTPENGPTNFLLAHLNNEGVPATAIATRILLCQQLQCAQCHEHPAVKEWGQAKFWEFNAFFQQCRIEEKMAYDPVQNRDVLTRELVNGNEFGPTYYQSQRGVVSVAYPRFGNDDVRNEPDQALRDQLADLMFATSRPQAARAFVNRIWAQFLGFGFTNPVDDMGPQSQVSHPVLLETLTAGFVESGYDVKRLIRWVCLSDAYQLSSVISEGMQPDEPQFGDVPTFARMYVRPLNAEQIYDSLQIAAGVEEADLFTIVAEQQREAWLEHFYQRVQTEENSEQSTFGGTLTQTLMMMNGDLVQSALDLEKSDFLGTLVKSKSLDDEERIRRLSLASLSRLPSASELRVLRNAVRQSVRQGVSQNLSAEQASSEAFRDLYWAYLNSSEFAVNH